MVFYKPITGKWHFVVVTSNDQDVLSQIDSWPGVEIESDTWTHIAGTYDGANAKFLKMVLKKQIIVLPVEQ